MLARATDSLFLFYFYASTCEDVNVNVQGLIHTVVSLDKE